MHVTAVSHAKDSVFSSAMKRRTSLVTVLIDASRKDTCEEDKFANGLGETGNHSFSDSVFAFWEPIISKRHVKYKLKRMRHRSWICCLLIEFQEGWQSWTEGGLQGISSIPWVSLLRVSICDEGEVLCLEIHFPYWMRTTISEQDAIPLRRKNNAMVAPDEDPKMRFPSVCWIFVTNTTVLGLLVPWNSPSSTCNLRKHLLGEF